MANTTLQIGIVSTTRGEVFARGLDGQMRRLAVGDPLYQGDVIVTANGSAVDVMPLDGQPFSVGEQQTVAVDMQVAPVETPVTLEAAKAPVAVNPAAGFDLRG